MSAPAQEAICDDSLIAPRDSPYGYRLRGDRCEGIYVREVTGTTLQVASLTESFEDYELASPQDLRVTWTLPRDAVVRLRAYPLRRNLYYRMDTVLPPGGLSFAWPIAILASLRLHQRDVGVAGWVHADVAGTDRRVYVPLRISQQREPESSGRYRVVLLPGRRLSEVYIHLARVEEDGRLGTFLLDGNPLQYGQYPAERAIAIPISELDAPGIYYLEIGADLTGGGVTTTHLYFYHPGW